jgi:VWFA-related protein
MPFLQTLALGLSLLITPPSSAQTPAPPETDPADVIRIETNLVRAHVTVTDKHGRPVKGLRASDFKIQDGNRDREIQVFSSEEDPYTLLVLQDVSNSMETQSDLAQKALRGFVDAASPTDTLALCSFGASLRCFPQSFARRDQVRPEPAYVPSGSAIYSALRKGEELLRNQQRGSGRLALVVITDGEDTGKTLDKALKKIVEDNVVYLNWNDTYDLEKDYRKGQRLHVPFDELKAIFKKSPVMVFPIELPTPGSKDKYRDRLKELAKATGGSFFQATGPADLARVYEQVNADLRTVYTVGFYRPEGWAPGDAARLKIRVSGKDLTVTVRNAQE